ncbi:hypothetical protein TYRP_007203 [Tyrophagus putrescentiae]|nr:hypothetical protein TYRP_007203 [Tyrophagus putrescentiae]
MGSGSRRSTTCGGILHNEHRRGKVAFLAVSLSVLFLLLLVGVVVARFNVNYRILVLFVLFLFVL